MNVPSRAFLEGLFEQYQSDPQSLDPEWRSYFESIEAEANSSAASLPSTNGEVLESPNLGKSRPDLSVAQLQDRVDQLIRGFRVRGHLASKIDPLRITRPEHRELAPESYGLLPSDMRKRFSTRTMNGTNVRTLDEIVEQMRNTYCRYIGVQFMHIDDYDVRVWLQKRMEGSENRIALNKEKQVRILSRLTDAVIFEEFMRRKFVGAKTFSLEGGETIVPLLDLAIEKAAEHDIKEIVIGMAHRGRLNVLANIMGKRTRNIFWGFDDPNPEEHRGGGDVLYHLGYSSDYMTSLKKRVHLSLCFNPSHLEFVNPVAMGRCRAKQDRIDDMERSQVMTLLIHGDAAFAGEGVVQETLNMSELNGYNVGGTLHVILNNQIGFTTPPGEGRSTTYASDVAKMLQIPIFHVNGEDPESVAQVVELAMEFRRKFHRDVVIDMYCYRRLGHNESDEPRFTQPLMYKVIDKRPTIRETYFEQLKKLNEVTQDEANELIEERRKKLEAGFDEAQHQEQYEPDTQSLAGYWEGYEGGPEPESEDDETGVALGKLSYVIDKIAEIPNGFSINRKLQRLIENRKSMGEGKRPLDWATAELAAFGTLAMEGHRVRLSGQDCGRGTFSQRHGVLHDVENGSRFIPLQHLSDDQADVDLINSPLSEAGVLGFDYGYSLDSPEALTVWEAQFGDFWNAAQVIVDQFITSAEDKWRRLSGLVMMLPHGFEGAGPEHCSARVERFLTLAAEHNVQIIQATTAAQHFHCLRRQVKRNWRKPAILLTPKSLLREPFVMSPLEEFSEGHFQKVIPDSLGPECDAPERVILATGKVAVELIKMRDESQRNDVAIIRLEQLYPLPKRELEAALSKYPDGTQAVWVQEEPFNMGAWSYIKLNFGNSLFDRWPLQVVCRPESASPSTGSKKTHKIEQAELLDRALNTQTSSVAH